MCRIMGSGSNKRADKWSISARRTLAERVPELVRRLVILTLQNGAVNEIALPCRYAPQQNQTLAGTDGFCPRKTPTKCQSIPTLPGAGTACATLLFLD
jgi:hypothetical protein